MRLRKCTYPIAGTSIKLSEREKAIFEKYANIKPKTKQLVNNRGFRAKLASNGKYYCGKKLDGPECYCCDGNCGPSDGCNCTGCQQLDQQARNLPNGWFVNRNGKVSRYGLQGFFYCGPHCDNYDEVFSSTYDCLPKFGHNCDACRKLDHMAFVRGRYYDLVDHELSETMHEKRAKYSNLNSDLLRNGYYSD